MGDESDPASTSFDELVDAAKFHFFDDRFERLFDDNWTNKGDCVRGEFSLIKMSSRFNENYNLYSAVAFESHRLGRLLKLATAYEAAYYAGHGWNGTDMVVAFGSWYAPPVAFGLYPVPYLWGANGLRDLQLLAGPWWTENDLVLCVSPTLP